MNQLQSLIISLQTKEMLLSANQQFACHRNWGSDEAFTHIVFIEKLEETILNASGKDLAIFTGSVQEITSNYWR